jgi:hypothetical protein
MSGRGLRVWLVALATGALLLGPVTAAQADGTVVVHGTQFPDARAQLAYVGCDDLFSRTDEVLAPTIGFGPGRAPSGARSLGYDLVGGSAIGSQHVVTSVLGNNLATLSVFAPEGTTGRAVVGYQAPSDRGTSVMWFGVAPVSVPAGGWTTVSATPRSYTWTRYDMSTRSVVASGPAEPVAVGDFVATRGGDGPGLYALTFGCDGAPFSMDAMQIGSPGAVTTYDLEGLATWLTIASSDVVVRAGQTVTISGGLATSNGASIAHATVILERRDLGSGQWENIRVVDAEDGTPAARIDPTRTALYRWRFVDRPLAEGSTSVPVLVTVVEPGAPAPPTSSPSPAPSPAPGQPTPTLPVPLPPSDDPAPSTPAPATPSPSTPAPATPDPTEGPTPDSTPESTQSPTAPIPAT